MDTRMYGVYEACHDMDERKALSVLFDLTEGLIAARRWRDLEYIMRQADLGAMTVAVMVGFLRGTYRVRLTAPEWFKLLVRVNSKLVEMEMPAEVMLRGLLTENESSPMRQQPNPTTPE